MNNIVLFTLQAATYDSANCVAEEPNTTVSTCRPTYCNYCYIHLPPSVCSSLFSSKHIFYMDVTICGHLRMHLQMQSCVLLYGAMRHHKDKCVVNTNSLFTPLTRKDKTVLSCLVRVSGVNTTADKTRELCLLSTQFPISKFSVIIDLSETEQLQIGNWVETIQKTHQN